MSDGLKPADAKIEPESQTTDRLWTGTGLCCEAQGDGVPCRGTDGECETCGRALPLPDAPALGPETTPGGPR